MDVKELHPILYNYIWFLMMSEKKVNKKYVVYLSYILHSISNDIHFEDFIKSYPEPTLSI